MVHVQVEMTCIRVRRVVQHLQRDIGNTLAGSNFVLPTTPFPPSFDLQHTDSERFRVFLRGREREFVGRSLREATSCALRLLEVADRLIEVKEGTIWAFG
jgi:hypothetical protein